VIILGRWFQHLFAGFFGQGLQRVVRDVLLVHALIHDLQRARESGKCAVTKAPTFTHVYNSQAQICVCIQAHKYLQFSHAHTRAHTHTHTQGISLDVRQLRSSSIWSMTVLNRFHVSVEMAGALAGEPRTCAVRVHALAGAFQGSEIARQLLPGVGGFATAARCTCCWVYVAQTLLLGRAAAGCLRACYCCPA